MVAIIQDVRYAARMLRANPAFALGALVTTALAIGANTAIFTVCDAVLVKPLPYAGADRLVALAERLPAGGRNTVSPATFLDWQARARAFSAMAATRTGTATIVEGERAVSVAVRAVTPNYFDLLGVPMVLGRGFRADEGDGRSAAAILSNYAWRTRFGSDPSIVGRTIAADGVPSTVVGVVGENAAFDLARIELFLPMPLAPATARRDTHVLTVIARLRSGITRASAQSEMDAVASAIAVEHPETNKQWGAVVDPLSITVVSASLRQSLVVLLGAVGAILLIGCANLANLTLTRSASRRREIAIRAAIGASRGRIVRQMLVESAVLSAAGGAVALVVGGWLLSGVTAIMPPGLLPPHAQLAVDWRVALFTAGAALFTAMLAGLAPAVVSARIDLQAALKEEGRGSASRARTRWRHALVVTQVAMATALLTGASLLVITLVRLLAVDPGFDPHNVLTLRVSLPSGRYTTPAQASEFYRAAVERLRGVAGVEQAAASTSLPLRGWLFGEPFEVEGRRVEKARRPYAHFQSVSPGYFQTLGLPLRAGRPFETADDSRGRLVVVVNQTLAERVFTNESPIGRHLVLDIGLGNVAAANTAWEIVGVVGRVKVASLADADAQSPEIYAPIAQAPVPAAWISLRTRIDPQSLARSVSDALARLDARVPLTRVSTMDEALDAATRPARFRMRLVGALAALALVLASIGIYSVRSYTVRERVPEIGIRMALGASPADVRRMVLREGAWVVMGGAVLGLFAAAVLTRALATLLFGVGATDPIVFASAAILMIVIGLAATELPARRAARIDPVQALQR